ncbi:hypothetical protein AAZX31_03G027500 [Glycine max]
MPNFSCVFFFFFFQYIGNNDSVLLRIWTSYTNMSLMNTWILKGLQWKRILLMSNFNLKNSVRFPLTSNDHIKARCSCTRSDIQRRRRCCGRQVLQGTNPVGDTLMTTWWKR